MKTFLSGVAALVVALAAALAIPGSSRATEIAGTAEAGVIREVQDQGDAARGWKCVCCTKSYKKACDVADEMEDKGYETKITKGNGYYEVWCR